MVIPRYEQAAFHFPDSPALMQDELIIDSFAGAGGVSIAIEKVFGRSPDIAINHNRIALETHALNHPSTLHVRENIWKVDPLSVTLGRPVGLFWASPDCRHFSKAKGGKPVSRRTRGLADVVVKWARDAQPRVIGMENVQEFQTWGPLIMLRNSRGKPKLDKHGKIQYIPDPERKGEYFERWKAALRRHGYHIEHRMIRCSDFGAPTSRYRFFLMARRDGLPIIWPEPTHGPGRAYPYRWAAELIDFWRPCPSIFERKRPLAEATMARIARGIKKFLLDSPSPFIVEDFLAKFHGQKREGEFRGQGLDEPFRTLDGSNRFGMVHASVMTNTAGHPGRPADAPAATLTTGNQQALQAASLIQVNHSGEGLRGQGMETVIPTVVKKRGMAVVASSLIHVGNGEAPGQAPRAMSMEQPITTVVSKGKHAVTAVSLQQYNGASTGQSVEQPAPTQLKEAKTAVLSAALLKHYTGVVGSDLRKGLGTVTQVDHHSMLNMHLSKFQENSVGVDARNLVPTLTGGGGGAGGTLGKVAVHLSKFHGTATGAPVDEPAPAILGQGGHLAAVYAFLVKYYGTAIGQVIDAPLDSVTGKPRFGIVLVTIEGTQYVLADIGLRMLQPNELARAHDFPEGYFLLGTKDQQVAMIGNSVPWRAAAALLRANLVQQPEAVAA